MSHSQQLAARISETKTAISQHQHALANRRTPSLEASLHSLQKRLAKLEAELNPPAPSQPAFQPTCDSAIPSEAAAQ